MSHAERLGAIDAAFFANETANAHLQVGAVLVFEPGPLSRPDGGIDMARIRRATSAGLHRVPRFHQRIDRVPLEGHPVWIDDARFDLDHHLRHTALPRPGDARQLKRLAGWLLSQPLDRQRPLWECWIVEGLADGRFALVPKLHHCMADGLAGVGALATLLRADAAEGEGADLAGSGRSDAAGGWRPRPAPGPVRLLADAALVRGREPLRLLAAALRSLGTPRRALESLRTAGGGALTALLEGFRPAPASALNPRHIGPHRRFDWLRTPLEEAHDVGRRLGGTVNDVVLAASAGALGRFLRQRGGSAREDPLRALVPVSVRAADGDLELSNRVVPMMVSLPIGAMEPAARLREVCEQTRRQKSSQRVHGAQLVEEAGDWLSPALVAEAMRLAWRLRTFNLVVTNVPGPEKPLHMLGSRLVEAYPVVPLFENQALGIALFSYDGWLHWGLNADRDALPDLHELADCIGREIAALREAAARQN